MTIQILENTDLFALDVDAYAQGVNCQGVMGSGIAKLFRDKFPGLFEAYHQEVQIYKRNNVSPLGDIFYFATSDGKMICNLFTQEYYGRTPGVVYASLDACYKTFSSLFQEFMIDGSSIKTLGIPKIGAGLGGLNWDDVLRVLTQAYNESGWNGDVFIAIQ